VGVLSSASRWREHVVPRSDDDKRRRQGTLRFIATITEESAITKILDSLGLASSPPLRRARAPDPQLDFDPVLSVA
jgi:hypothetical protein